MKRRWITLQNIPDPNHLQWSHLQHKRSKMFLTSISYYYFFFAVTLSFAFYLMEQFSITNPLLYLRGTVNTLFIRCSVFSHRRTSATDNIKYLKIWNGTWTQTQHCKLSTISAVHPLFIVQNIGFFIVPPRCSSLPLFTVQIQNSGFLIPLPSLFILPLFIVHPQMQRRLREGVQAPVGLCCC